MRSRAVRAEGLGNQALGQKETRKQSVRDFQFYIEKERRDSVCEQQRSKPMTQACEIRAVRGSQSVKEDGIGHVKQAAPNDIFSCKQLRAPSRNRDERLAARRTSETR